MSTRRSLWLSLECLSAVWPTSDDHAVSRAARLSNHSSATPSHGSWPSCVVEPVTRHTRYFRRSGSFFAYGTCSSSHQRWNRSRGQLCGRRSRTMTLIIALLLRGDESHIPAPVMMRAGAGDGAEI